jgi:SpoVK/Ycf46/Vps4 family AAA+-type ATPase
MELLNNDKKEMSSTVDLKSFHYLENGEISFSILDTIKTQKKLDSGLYTISWLPFPESKLLLTVNTDKETVKMHQFPDKEKIEDLLKIFFDKNVVTKMSSLGFYHKVGILLYGKQGTGKSTIVKNYATKIIEEHNGLVFYFNGKENIAACWSFLRKIRAIQDNPIVVIFEEIDSFVNDKSEGSLKIIFDGNESMDNCIIFGTTNYLERIPSALKDRPSRFKYVLNIEGIQSEDEVFEILHNMIGDLFTAKELKHFSKKLIGNSLDYIKQFAIDKIMSLDTYGHNSKSQIGFTK